MIDLDKLEKVVTDKMAIFVSSLKPDQLMMFNSMMRDWQELIKLQTKEKENEKI